MHFYSSIQDLKHDLPDDPKLEETKEKDLVGSFRKIFMTYTNQVAIGIDILS